MKKLPTQNNHILHVFLFGNPVNYERHFFLTFCVWKWCWELSQMRNRNKKTVLKFHKHPKVQRNFHNASQGFPSIVLTFSSRALPKTLSDSFGICFFFSLLQCSPHLGSPCTASPSYVGGRRRLPCCNWSVPDFMYPNPLLGTKCLCCWARAESSSDVRTFDVSFYSMVFYVVRVNVKRM